MYEALFELRPPAAQHSAYRIKDNIQGRWQITVQQVAWSCGYKYVVHWRDANKSVREETHCFQLVSCTGKRKVIEARRLPNND